jgi:predicted permease
MMIRRLWHQTAGLWAVVAVLAFAAAATATAMVVAHGLLLSPLPGPDPERLVGLGGLAYGRGLEDPVTFWSQAEALDSLAFYRVGDLPYGVGTEWARVAQISGRLFDVFKVPPSRGRSPIVDDERHDRRVAVISDAFWSGKYSRSEAVLGTSIRLGGSDYTVIGVAARGFDYPSSTEVWIPLVHTESLRPLLVEGAGGRPLVRRSLGWIGRIKPNTTLAELRGQLEALLAHANSVLATKSGVRYGDVVGVSSLLEGTVRSYRTPISILIAAALMLMVAAITNCTLFSLSLYSRRRSEFALRQALGASVGRIRRHLLAEAMTVGTIAGLIGLVISIVMMDWARRALYPLGVEIGNRPYLWAWVLASSMLLAIGPTVLAAILASGKILTGKLGGLLQLSTNVLSMPTGGASRRVLIVLQIALSFMLASGALISANGAIGLQRVELGHEPASLVVARIAMASHPTVAQDGRLLLEALVAGVGRARSVTSASSVQKHVLRGSERGYQQITSDRAVAQMASILSITGAYADALGVRTLAGKAALAQANEIFINENLARQLWDGNAIGRTLRIAGDPTVYVVVGVTSDTKAVDEATAVPMVHRMQRALVIDPKSPAVRADILVGCEDRCDTAVREVHEFLAQQRDVFVYSVARGQDVYRGLTEPARTQASLLLSYAVLGLLVSGFGVGAMTSHAVLRRRVEIGVRLALGATRIGIIRLILREAIVLLAVGTFLGLVGVIWIGSLLRVALGVSEPITVGALLVICACVSGTCLAGCSLPMIRLWRSSGWDVLLRP